MQQSLTEMSKMFAYSTNVTFVVFIYSFFCSWRTSVGYLSYCFLKHDEK